MADTEELASPRTIGDRMTLILRHRRMSVRDLEEASGVPVRSLYRYLEDAARPPYDRLVRVAKALGVSPNDLLGWDSTSRGTPPYLSSPLAA